jgi:colicin import membrane protein
MSEQKESSVLFSLKELMSLEEDRIRGEEEQKAAAAAAAEKARLEAEKIAREAEEARIRAEEERRRTDEQRSREETARLEAIRIAEVEKARLETEQKARLDAMTAQQSHERSLAALKHDESKKSLRKMLIYGAVAVVILGGGGTFLGVRSYQESQRLAAAERQEKERLEEENKKALAEAKAQAAKMESLLAQLNSAKDEATRLALQKQLEEAKKEQEEAARRRGGGGKPAAGGGTKPACNCTPGDPLCSCL